MTIYAKDEIRAGIVMEKDCGDSIFVAKSTPTVPLSEISERLDAARKRLDDIARAIAANRK